jgi:DNA-binding transcriptional ArsR family regulator
MKLHVINEESVNTLLMALADPTRRQIVEILSDGKVRSVSEITAHFGMSRQAVTKHLTILRGAGIVASERQGRDRNNRLQPRGFEPLREWFNHYSTFWDDRLEALKRQVEQEGEMI